MGSLEFLPRVRDDGIALMAPFRRKTMQPEQENLAEPSASPLLAQSMAAFYRNLPELLKKHYGKWVAYQR
jgi:hypothetical protein